MENKTLTKTQEFFNSLKDYTPTRVTREWKWYTDTKKHMDGAINQEYLTNFKDKNDLNLRQLSNLLGVHTSAIGRPLSSSIILRLCDAYCIHLREFLDNKGIIERKTHVIEWDELKDHEYTFTPYLSFTADQVAEIIADFYTIQGFSMSYLCKLLDLSYISLSRGIIVQSVLDSLTVYYDLRGANFKKFLGYLEEKKWFPYLEEIKSKPFIKSLLEQDIETISKKLNSGTYKIIEDLEVDPTIRFVDFITYGDTEKLNKSNTISYKVDSDKYQPLFNKNDILLIRELDEREIIKDKGYYLIATPEKIAYGECAIVQITPDNGLYNISTLASIKKKLSMVFINFIVVGEVILHIITE